MLDQFSFDSSKNDFVKSYLTGSNYVLSSGKIADLLKKMSFDSGRNDLLRILMKKGLRIEGGSIPIISTYSFDSSKADAIGILSGGAKENVEEISATRSHEAPKRSDPRTDNSDAGVYLGAGVTLGKNGGISIEEHEEGDLSVIIGPTRGGRTNMNINDVAFYLLNGFEISGKKLGIRDIPEGATIQENRGGTYSVTINDINFSTVIGKSSVFYEGEGLDSDLLMIDDLVVLDMMQILVVPYQALIQRVQETLGQRRMDEENIVEKKSKTGPIIPEGEDEELPEGEEEGLCQVCMVNRAACIVLDCGHQCLCIKCSRAVLFHNGDNNNNNNNNPECPMCRTVIKIGIRKVFLS